MNIVEIKNREKNLIDELLNLWENSVKATHQFLSNEEIEKIKKYVPEALKEVQYLIIAENEENIPIAFMGINEKRLEMLFVKNNEIGKGIGRQLLTYGIKNYDVNELTVNE